MANKEVRTFGVKFSYSILDIDRKTFSGARIIPSSRYMYPDPNFRLKGDILTPKTIIALRQATAAYTGAPGLYLEGFGAIDRMLYTRARQYGQRNGWFQGVEGGSQSRGRLHGKHSSNLPHKGINGTHHSKAIPTL